MIIADSGLRQKLWLTKNPCIYEFIDLSMTNMVTKKAIEWKSTIIISVNSSIFFLELKHYHFSSE